MPYSWKSGRWRKNVEYGEITFSLPEKAQLYLNGYLTVDLLDPRAKILVWADRVVAPDTRVRNSLHIEIRLGSGKLTLGKIVCHLPEVVIVGKAAEKKVVSEL